MGSIVLFAILAAEGILFTGIGIFAIKREEPMWFWSGTNVSKEEITDVRAYNRANGIMWITFSAIFWISSLFSLFGNKYGGICMIAGLFAGIPGLVIAYSRIYKKYSAKKG